MTTIGDMLAHASNVMLRAKAAGYRFDDKDSPREAISKVCNQMGIRYKERDFLSVTVDKIEAKLKQRKP